MKIALLFPATAFPTLLDFCEIKQGSWRSSSGNGLNGLENFSNFRNVVVLLHDNSVK